jgi:membrane associated rhomboid family serine protease
MNHGRRFHLPLPPATKALFVANVAVFVANLLTFGLLSSPAKGAWFAFSWPGLLDGYGLGLLRVVTYQFTHSFVDPMHVLMNMLALWVFGPMVEARLGRLGTLRAYLWAGVAGAIGHLVVAVLQGSTAVPLVGASGACYGLLVYAACAEPQARIVFFIVQVPLWALASLLCGLGAYSTFVELATGHAGGVAHSAHLGGAALGFVAFRLGWFRDWLDLAGAKHPGPIARWREGWRRRSAARSQAATEARELQLDAILAKVKAEGLAALRPDERRFLERMSERARGPGS